MSSIWYCLINKKRTSCAFDPAIHNKMLACCRSSWTTSAGKQSGCLQTNWFFCSQALVGLDYTIQERNLSDSLETFGGSTSCILDYHAFWRNGYNTQTKFASYPHSTSTSIIGIDFYMLGQLGEEHGPWGELFPLSHPPGRGFMRCIEDTNHTNYWDILYIDQTIDFTELCWYNWFWIWA